MLNLTIESKFDSVTSGHHFTLLVTVSEILTFKVSVNNVNKMLIVSIECKGDCVGDADITDKCWLLEYQAETNKNSICSIELRRQSNGIRAFFRFFYSFSIVQIFTHYCIPLCGKTAQFTDSVNTITLLQRESEIFEFILT